MRPLPSVYGWMDSNWAWTIAACTTVGTSVRCAGGLRPRCRPRSGPRREAGGRSGHEHPDSWCRPASRGYARAREPAGQTDLFGSRQKRNAQASVRPLGYTTGGVQSSGVVRASGKKLAASAGVSSKKPSDPPTGIRACSQRLSAIVRRPTVVVCSWQDLLA